MIYIACAIERGDGVERWEFGWGVKLLVVDTRGLVGHLGISIAQVFTNIHGQSASATTKSVSFGSKLSAITLLAPKGIVMGIDIGGVQSFVAKVALEANLMPLLATGQEFFSRIHGLVASKTNCRHGDCCRKRECG